MGHLSLHRLSFSPALFQNSGCFVHNPFVRCSDFVTGQQNTRERDGPFYCRRAHFNVSPDRTNQYLNEREEMCVLGRKKWIWKLWAEINTRSSLLSGAAETSFLCPATPLADRIKRNGISERNESNWIKMSVEPIKLYSLELLYERRIYIYTHCLCVCVWTFW